MDLLVLPDGTVRAVYAEDIDLDEPRLRRHQPEPAMSNRMPRVAGSPICSPVNGPVLGPFNRRSEALAAELAWLEANWLARQTD